MPEIPMGNQLYEGRGLSSVTGTVFGTALDFAPLQRVPGGQTTSFELVSIASSRELTEKLRIAASASFKSGWGASAEFTLSSSRDVNRYYTYALIRCNVTNPPVVLRNPKFKPEAEALLVQQGWDAFAAAYGWEYVEGFVEGGAYYGLIEIQTTTETQQQNVKVKLSGHYGPFSASAEFERDLIDIQKSIAINVSVTRSGGSGTPVMTDLSGMLNEARNFPQTALNAPVRFLALTADYARTVPLPSVPPPNSLPRQQQRATLEDLGRWYLLLRDYKASIEFVLGRRLTEFDEYRGLEAAQLTAKRQELHNSLHAVGAEIDEIVRRAGNCADDFSKCQTYSPTVQLLTLPTIQGELLNLKQMEEKLVAMEQSLRSQGLLGGGLATLNNGLAVRGDMTVGAQGNGRLSARHVDGKRADGDAPDPLYLNWATGKPVMVGGFAPADLHVHGQVHVNGDVHLAAGKTVSSGGRMHVAGPEFLYVLNSKGLIVGKEWGGTGEIRAQGNIGVAGMDPVEGLPAGFGGGVHTWDVFAEGSVSVGPPGEVKAAMWNNGDITGRSKRFLIDHPLRPETESLVHAAVEGPEAAVYYRGEGRIVDGRGCVELPTYFEALTREEGRTVLVTPVSTGDEVVVPLTVSPVVNNCFLVRTSDGSPVSQGFFWEVKAVRADVTELEAEVQKEAATGPGRREQQA